MYDKLLSPSVVLEHYHAGIQSWCNYTAVPYHNIFPSPEAATTTAPTKTPGDSSSSSGIIFGLNLVAVIGIAVGVFVGLVCLVVVCFYSSVAVMIGQKVQRTKLALYNPHYSRTQGRSKQSHGLVESASFHMGEVYNDDDFGVNSNNNNLNMGDNEFN